VGADDLGGSPRPALKATAVLPVKRFGAAKRRLAAGIDAERREALVGAMLEDVLEAIAAARSIERTIVVTNEPRAREAASAAGAEIVPDPGEDPDPVNGRRPGSGSPVDAEPAEARVTGAGAGNPDPGAGGHSKAALAGIARAEEQGARCVVLLPGDCPLLEPSELNRLLTGMPGSYVGIVPDRHGTGTNALALTPPGAIRPAFGEGSCARHVAAAREAGVPYGVEEIASLALDLDTPADVVALTRELGRRRNRAKRTAKALGL
jgi:2-phospho-L-lactate/phosphoenolpyruvate guanylyltransferase